MEIMQKESNSEHGEPEGGFSNLSARESVRDFAGKIAHDFNNLLTPLLAYPQLIRSELPPGSTSRGLLDVIEEMSETMAHVASRLVALAISRKNQQHPISVDRVVSEVLSDIENDNIALGITIVPPVASEVPILVPHDVLTGPIKEICINALEAMGGDGVLTITAELLTLDDPAAVAEEGLLSGEYACIRVHDTGRGMTQEVRDKAFEPFFSEGKPTRARCAGLGLSIALAAVGDCGGNISFGSPAEDGFTVSILFPVSALQVDESSDEGASSECNDNTDLNRPRVLVVDDEEPIVELFKLMLESEIPNVDVDIASNGLQAVESFRERRHEVILMDLHMPVMDGQAAFSRLTELCSSSGWDIPSVIFCTGYTPPNGVQIAVANGVGHDLLQKPVTTEVLVRAVKSRLISEQ
jgi:CheY-like chemotaxis protein